MLTHNDGMPVSSNKPQSIEAIRKQFRSEWLLIGVDEVDGSTTTPRTGILLDHGQSPEKLWEKATDIAHTTMVIYSEDWPDDLAACFFILS